MSYISVLEKLNYGTMGLIELAIQRWLEKGDDIALDEAEGESREVIEELRALSANALLEEDCSAASALLDAIAWEVKMVLEKINKINNEEVKTNLQEIYKTATRLSSRVENLFWERLRRTVYT